MQAEALNAYLKPIKEYLDDPHISEILVNKPHEVYYEKRGRFSKVECPDLTFSHLNKMTSLIANYNRKPFGENHPRLNAMLPQGHRVQVVAPPIVEHGLLAISIRKQVIANITLNEYNMGFFSGCHYRQYSKSTNQLINKINPGFDVKQYLLNIVDAKKTVLIAGGTSTGKTTFLNACLKHIPHRERLIVLEDTREVHLAQPNHLCLIAGHNGEKEQKADMDANLKASLRLRPDRIVVGELRGEEAATFLDAASTGHEGSFATIHASNPNLAIERLATMCEKASPSNQSHESLRRHITQVIDVIIQIKRDSGGRRYLSDIWSFE